MSLDSKSNPLRVGIDARLAGPQGGVGSFVVGLASGLSRLEGSDEYLFLTIPGSNAWLTPYLGASARSIDARSFPVEAPPWQKYVRKYGGFIKNARGPWTPFTNHMGVKVPTSDGVLEAERIQVIHLTAQGGFYTDIPTIYHPHDLQHLHLPEYFTPRQIAKRELFYRTLCEQATTVVVSSSWTKSDLIANYGITPSKIQVIELAPLLSEYPVPSRDDVERTRCKFDLPDNFILYPAQTWPHKNHINLLEALGQLRRRRLDISLVCCGEKTQFFQTIDNHIQKKHLRQTVKFLGFVDPLDLQCLYRLSRGVIIPSKFESASFPLWEAFAACTPAACSAVTSLPEQAGDAALLFNPDRPDEIADAIASLLTDEALRESLIERGADKVSQLSWTDTARTFRALYRKIVGHQLTDAERMLLRQSDSDV